MADSVSWMLELKIKPGELENLKDLMLEMVDSTRATEPGTLIYEWSVDADQQTCHLWERYADSAAALTHLGHFGEKFADRFMTALEPTRFTVYGNPSAEVEDALRPFGAVHYQPFGGFSR